VQPERLPEISRGLSASDTPGTSSKIKHPESGARKPKQFPAGSSTHSEMSAKGFVFETEWLPQQRVAATMELWLSSAS
jgi:hypothetical protein